MEALADALPVFGERRAVEVAVCVLLPVFVARLILKLRFADSRDHVRQASESVLRHGP